MQLISGDQASIVYCQTSYFPPVPLLVIILREDFYPFGGNWEQMPQPRLWLCLSFLFMLTLSREMVGCPSLEYSFSLQANAYIMLCFNLQDGDQADDDQDEDGPREADLEGRVEKYIGVKVKACNFLL